ncbi:uncharacterized protein LOC142020428 isoform X2 [Carettochelys insculpta]|uniref:uncharacterized protein LOC142020428 isoform X2 n=1 Tax=Carettochelys insculpta TaxID=44489 RepID=UPI003EBC5823
MMKDNGSRERLRSGAEGLLVSLQILEKHAGSRLDKSSRDMTTPKRARMAPPFNIVPPVEEMRTLTVGERVRTPLARTHWTTPPTWVQIKTLSQEAEKVLIETQKPKTALLLFLAMLAVLTTTVNDSRWMPGPYDNRGSLAPSKEGCIC